MTNWGKKAGLLWKASIVVVGMIGGASMSVACQKGYVETDVPGVCMESPEMANPWVSDEKPPADKMPSWQRENIKVIDAPSMTAQDEREDRERAEADKDGKKKAGIRS